MKTGRNGFSLVEILIAIGILGAGMLLIAMAFPAGVAMSIAVSDETQSQAVFQKATSEIKAAVKRDHIPTGTENMIMLPEQGFADVLKSRQYNNSPFSWAALIRPVNSTSTGPMGKLCHIVIVVSRYPGKALNFHDEFGNDSDIPELLSVHCNNSDENARTITIDDRFNLVPNGGYIIDSATGTAHIITSRNKNNTVTVLARPPADINGKPREFFVIPGAYVDKPDGRTYGRKSPAIRTFQSMLYLP